MDGENGVGSGTCLVEFVLGDGAVGFPGEQGLEGLFFVLASCHGLALGVDVAFVVFLDRQALAVLCKR